MIKIRVAHKSSTGPSVAELLSTVEKYAPVRRAVRLASNPGLSTGEAVNDQQAWANNTSKKLHQKLQLNEITSDDEQLYRSIEASGVLNLEPELAREMTQMMSQSQVSIASLEKCDC